MPIPIPKKLSQLFKLRVIAAVDEDGRELSLCISDPVYDPNDSGKLIGGVFSFKKAGILLGAVTDYYRGDGTWQPMNKAAVGLSNVDNTPDLNKPISVDQAAADLATLNSAKTYADVGDLATLNSAKTYADVGDLATLNSAKTYADVGDLATLNSAKAYTDAMTTGLLQFIGNWSASGGLYPTTGGSGAAGAVVIGDVWRVSAAGTIGGVNYRIGDSFYATSNTPAQDPTKWASILLELGYNPEDVANKVTAFSSPTNAQYPSALLVKTQLDLKLNDVTNGTGTGATQVRTPVAGTREIARIAAASTDVVVTQGAAGAPNTIGLNGTTLKYWAETRESSIGSITWNPITVGDWINISTSGAFATFGGGGYALKLAQGVITIGASNTAPASVGLAAAAITMGYGNNVGDPAVVLGRSSTSSAYQGYNVVIGNNCIAVAGNATGAGSVILGNNTTNNSGGSAVAIGRYQSGTGQGSTLLNAATATDYGTQNLHVIGSFQHSKVPSTFGSAGATLGSTTPAGFVQAAVTTGTLNQVVGSLADFTATVDLRVRVSAGGVDRVIGAVRVQVIKHTTAGVNMYYVPCVLLGGNASLLTYFDFKLDIVSNQLVLFWKLLSAYPSAATTDDITFSGVIKTY